MSEAPERIWMFPDTENGGEDVHITRIEPNRRGYVEYLRKDAACVEVKEGYGSCKGPRFAYGPDGELCPLSEALTLRTVEDVRREALMEAVRLLELPSGLMTPPAAQRIRNLIDNPASSREDCPECKGTGMRDSGGVYPWGEHIDVPCDCGEPQPTPSREKNKCLHPYCGERCGDPAEPQPTPSPEPEPVAWQQRLESGSWGTIFHGQEKPIWGEARPLYTSPPTPASHAEELRKAKEEAWDEGYQWAYDGMSQRNPYAAPDEGGGK